MLVKLSFVILLKLKFVSVLFHLCSFVGFDTSITSVKELLEVGNIRVLNPIRTCCEVCVKRHFDMFRVDDEHQDCLRRIGRFSSGICGLSPSNGSERSMFFQPKKALG